LCWLCAPQADFTRPPRDKPSNGEHRTANSMNPNLPPKEAGAITVRNTSWVKHGSHGVMAPAAER
jgi:hypothetical protein